MQFILPALFSFGSDLQFIVFPSLADPFPHSSQLPCIPESAIRKVWIRQEQDEEVEAETKGG